MKALTILGGLAGAMLLIGVAACSSDDSTESASNSDSGADGGGGSNTDSGSKADGAKGDASSSPDGAAGDTGDSATNDDGGEAGSGSVECGGQTCTAANPQLGAPCCTSDNQCGLQTQLSQNCLPANAPGGLDTSCPDYSVGGFFTLQGCCGPNGCGALDTFENLGCVSNQDLGASAMSCNYNPSNTCTSFLPIACDGPEDCPANQVCCGEFALTGYVGFGCYSSCADAAAAAAADAGIEAGPEGGAPNPAGPTFFEMCHAGGSCQTSGYSCLTSTYLPDFLSRCYTMGNPPGASLGQGANEVNCGTGVCGSGQQCCLRAPKDPYCGPADQPCDCAGTGATDGGVPDATTDGAPDAGGGGPETGGADAAEEAAAEGGSDGSDDAQMDGGAEASGDSDGGP